MEHSPIGSLPPELRTEIFAFALTRTEPVVLVSERERSSQARRWRLHHPQHALALLYTCKLIRRECGDAFISFNEFELRGLGINGLFEGLHALERSTGKRRFALLRSFSIVPTELDGLRWRRDRRSFSEALPLAIARLRLAKASTGAEVLKPKCAIGYAEDNGEHCVDIQLVVERLEESWRLMEWQMMLEMLALPDFVKLPEIDEALQLCGRQLKHMGLLMKS